LLLLSANSKSAHIVVIIAIDGKGQQVAQLLVFLEGKANFVHIAKDHRNINIYKKSSLYSVFLWYLTYLQWASAATNQTDWVPKAADYLAGCRETEGTLGTLDR